MERITLKTSLINVSDIDYKHDDLLMFSRLKNSLQLFGQIRPINVYKEGENYFCFEGKRILKATKELGHENIECNIFNFAFNNYYKGLHLMLNEIHFKKCDVEVGKILQSITNPDPSLIPFSQEQIDNFIKLLTFDWEELKKKKNTTQQTNLFD